VENAGDSTVDITVSTVLTKMEKKNVAQEVVVLELEEAEEAMAEDGVIMVVAVLKALNLIRQMNIIMAMQQAIRTKGKELSKQNRLR